MQSLDELYLLTRLDELVEGDDPVSVPIHFLPSIFLVKVLSVHAEI